MNGFSDMICSHAVAEQILNHFLSYLQFTIVWEGILGSCCWKFVKIEIVLMHLNTSLLVIGVVSGQYKQWHRMKAEEKQRKEEQKAEEKKKKDEKKSVQENKVWCYMLSMY